MGAAAIMANTALATAGDLPLMASAFRQAIEAGRKPICPAPAGCSTGPPRPIPSPAFFRD